MAIYVPASRRRRNAMLFTVAALVIGIALGLFAGRATAPSLDDRVSDVQGKAREATSQLRVVSLHQEEDTGSEGTTFALERARDELIDALDDAPWISVAEREALMAQLNGLVDNAGSAGLADEIEALAKDIDAAFGID